MKLSLKRSTKEKNAGTKGKLPNNNTNVDWQIADFNYNAKYCANQIATFVLRRENVPVYPDIKPGHLRQYLDATAPVRPQSFKNIIGDFFTYIFPMTAHWNHPKFAAYYPAGNAFANIYGDMLSTAFGGVGFSWTAQPSLTELENVMMDWFARALNLPSQFIFDDSKGEGGGCTHNTASDAIYTTIVAARHIKLKEAGCYPDPEKPHHTKSEAPHPGITLEKLVAYTSHEAHSCVEKGCRIAMCTLNIIQPDINLSLDGNTLEQCVRNDIRKGLIPFYCCATLGTPGPCSYDNVYSIGSVCQRYDIYLHVDAAYAGNAMILPENGWLLHGLQYANSISINPYKLMLGALDLSCLFVKNAKDYKAPFFIDATYLLDEFENESDKEIKRNEIDYRHYGIALSRRMRSLKLFFLFRMHGVRILQEYIRDVTYWAKIFEKSLKVDDRFEILNAVTLGVVVFRQKPTSANDEDDEPEDDRQNDPQTDKLATFTETDKKNLNLVLRINKSRELHLLPCIHSKRYALRVSINYEHITDTHIGNMVKTIKNHYVDRLDSSLRNYFKSSPKVILREISRLSFIHLLKEKDYPEFEKRQKDPATATIPLTFGPVFVPPASKSAAENNDETDEESVSETKTRVSLESKKWGTKLTQRFRTTKVQGASNYVLDSEDDYDYDDDDN